MDNLGYKPSNPIAESQQIQMATKKEDPKVSAMIVFALIVGIILGWLIFGRNNYGDWKQLKATDDAIINAFVDEYSDPEEASNILTTKSAERKEILNRLGY